MVYEHDVFIILFIHWFIAFLFAQSTPSGPHNVLKQKAIEAFEDMG